MGSRLRPRRRTGREARKDFKAIRSSQQRCLRLIDDLLQVFRAEQEGLQIDLSIATQLWRGVCRTLQTPWSSCSWRKPSRQAP